MEALTIFSCVVAAIATAEWLLTSREVRRLNRELRESWSVLQMAERTHSTLLRAASERHVEQLYDLAITLTAQAKATSAHEAVDVHHAVMAGRAEPEPIERTPPPVKGIKLREGLEIDFITPPTSEQMAEVDEEMVLR